MWTWTSAPHAGPSVRGRPSGIQRAFDLQPLGFRNSCARDSKTSRKWATHVVARVSKSGRGAEEAGKGFGTAPPPAPPELKVGEREAGRTSITPEDAAFEEKLRAVKKSAAEKKAAKESQRYAAIDYDNPEPDTSEVGSFLTKDLGSKIGIGIAATVFAAIFAFGDIFPPPAPPNNTTSPSNKFAGSVNALTPQQRDKLQNKLKEFEAMLESSQDDTTALEGAAVISVELGDLPRADELLSRLEKLSGAGDAEVLRLHGEVQYALGKFSDSAASFQQGLKLPGASASIELLQGLSEALIADNKPREAVDQILAAKDRLKETSAAAPEVSDPVQLELLLGKAYSSWGKAGDAAAVYDNLIKTRPEDFRGYLAKGTLFKDQGKEGDAQRMFLQAKYLAPEAAKTLIDRLAASS